MSGPKVQDEVWEMKRVKVHEILVWERLYETGRGGDRAERYGRKRQ